MSDNSSAPLYTLLRPESFDEIVGQKNTVKLITSFLERGYLPSMIFFGPPGCGKTTIAKIAARLFDAKLYFFSAVRTSTVDLKKVIYQDQNSIFVKKQIVFIDELHRYNKAQQDIFLPMIEEDGVVFIGATTENPSFSVNNALLSRTRVMKFTTLDSADTAIMLERGIKRLGAEISGKLIDIIAEESAGDLRIALSTLESAYYLSDRKNVTEDDVLKVLYNPAKYDKKGDGHYRVISAFIKSMRGSDPDASLFYMMKMLESGEDPLFILRRMIIFASEDIGNADPKALEFAVSALEAFKNIGLPEGEIIMSHAVTYLATAPKSNASYLALHKAKEFFSKHKDLMPPQHIINESSLAPGETKGRYRYPHDYPGHWIDENYFPDEIAEIPKFYEPDNMGYESKIAKFWETLKKLGKN